MAEKKLKFEESMTRLQEIVDRLESGEEPLESAMKLFEEGAKLSASCYETLDRAEQKVTDLRRAGEQEGQDGLE